MFLVKSNAMFVAIEAPTKGSKYSIIKPGLSLEPTTACINISFNLSENLLNRSSGGYILSFHDLLPETFETHVYSLKPSEPISLDEAFLDVTDSVTECNTPQKMAYNLKARVQSELNLTLSVGVATSKSVAKIASDMNKPDGLMVVGPGTEKAFLAPLPGLR